MLRVGEEGSCGAMPLELICVEQTDPETLALDHRGPGHDSLGARPRAFFRGLRQA